VKEKKVKKKKIDIFDEHGNWVEERNRWIGALRRSFRVHPFMKDVLTNARVELPPKILKNGTQGKKNQIRYKCAICNKLFSQKHTQVDHRDPVVPLFLKSAEMLLDTIARRIYCKKENLQVLCSTPLKLLPKGTRSCHAIKTDEENFLREKWDKKLDSEGIYDIIDKELLHKIQGKELENIWKNEYQEHLSEKVRIAQEKELRRQQRLLKKKK
jgi:hypothetical protein